MKVRKKRRPGGLLKIKEGFSYYQKTFLQYCLVGRNLFSSVANFPYGIVTVSSERKWRIIKLTVLTVGNTSCPKMMMVVFAHSVKVMELVQKEVIRKFSRGISTRRISIFRVGRKNVIKEDTTHRCLIEKVAAHVSLLLLLKCLCFWDRERKAARVH